MMRDSVQDYRPELPLREFKASVRNHVNDLLKNQGDGFRYPDIARRLGGQYARNMPSGRRLQNCLDGMLKAGVLARRSGWYGAGATIGEHYALGVAPSLFDDLYRAFYKAGGIMAMPGILFELDRGEDSEARLVRTIIPQ